MDQNYRGSAILLSAFAALLTGLLLSAALLASLASLLATLLTGLLLSALTTLTTLLLAPLALIWFCHRCSPEGRIPRAVQRLLVLSVPRRLYTYEIGEVPMIENNRAGAQFLCQRGSMAMSRALKQMNSFEMALAGEQLSGRMLVL
jgi:hypothetical protein